MTTPSLVLITLIAACSKASSPTPPETSAPTPPSIPAVAPAPPPPPPPLALGPCPADKALDAKLAVIFRSTADSISDPVCVAGKFPAPGWYVSANVTNSEGGIDWRTAIVDAGGKTLTSSSDEIPPGLADASGSYNHQAIDFDQDGVDEILYVDKMDRRGWETNTLIVMRLVKGKWESALARNYVTDNSAAGDEEAPVVSCESTWAIDSKSITFTPKGKPQGDGDSCVLAKETWVFANGTFAKVPEVATKKGS